jgi:ribonuclease R
LAVFLLKGVRYDCIIGQMAKITLDEIKKNLQDLSHPVKVRELSRFMGIPADGYPGFRRLIKDAVASGQLTRIRGGRLSINSKPNVVQGRLLLSRTGHGFVMPNDKTGEIYISSRDLGGALHGEDVKLIIKDTRAGKNREGKILEVINREKGRLVGQLYRSRYGMHIAPQDPHFPDNIQVDNHKNLTLKDNLIVTIRLYPFEASYIPPRGFIEEVIGEAGSPGIDIDSLVISHGLPREFPADLKPELAKIRKTISKQELSNRLDLRKILIFTIDPADAKDHDDAISLEPLENGHYRLGVHIADVSHYVKEGSALDREAKIRGNSVYLVDRVIPMLPEKLSANICSLVENQDRLTVSFLAEIDDYAKVYEWHFEESAINSFASLTYEEVQARFDRAGKSRIDAASGKVLDKMLAVSQVLRSKRIEKGSLDFDLPEPTVLLDSEGKVIDIFTAARMPSHQVVEEFMLLANRYTATLLETNGIPILYRVHDKPDKEKIENFAALLKEMGYAFNFKGDITPKKIQRVLETVKGKPEEPFVEEILLRSLAKAVYQPENIGHFGLAFSTYTHFTSPIRRYPDLLVHRILKAFLNHQITNSFIADIAPRLKGIGVHCSSTEAAADEAERDSIKIKQLEYLSERVGGVFEGVISGVVKPGFFVELVGSMVEGFVPFNSISDDYFVLDEGKHRAYGRRTQRLYRLGDRVKIIVVKVDMEARRADFSLVSETEYKKKKKQR